MERFFTLLRFVQNDRVLVCSHGLKIRAIGMRYEIRVTRCEYFYHKVQMIAFLSTLRNIRDVLGSAQVFQFMYVEKNLFYYKEILHFATLRSE